MTVSKAKASRRCTISAIAVTVSLSANNSQPESRIGWNVLSVRRRHTGNALSRSRIVTKAVVREVPTTVSQYLREIPGALGHMDYEIRGNSVLGHSDQGTVVINLTYEGERHLGSLDLPLTQVEIMCIGHTDEQAESFLKHYDAAMFRAGGG